MKRKIIIGFVAITLFVGLQSGQDRFFEISKNIETFNMLFKELNRNYVDDVDPSELMKIGIDAMLESLDPYTVYLSGAELDNYRMATTGKYGGIGARIGLIDDKVTVTDPYEDFPAFNAGIRAGDVILEVDGKSTKGYNTEDVSQILRGQPGTEVKVKIERPISKEQQNLTIKRGDIKINNVPYYGLADDKTGYIKLSNFSQNAGKEVADALTELKDKHNIEGVILDLRGNGGGLLFEAINVTNVFIDKGVEVVSTKGKLTENNKAYSTLNKAVDTEFPLVVLTDQGSASASEIVSGAIQDLDRGVVIGQSTFGKGLVQITRPLPYKSKLKVTTSKYYIPSGRCIQAVDYVNRSLDEQAEALPDSLRRAFKTKNGRTVLDGAGVDPDIIKTPEMVANITRSLVTKNHVFHYATKYVANHPNLRDGTKFKLTDAEYQDFLSYISDKDYDYTTYSERKIEELLEIAEDEKMLEAISATAKTLESQIEQEKTKDLEKYADEIKEFIELQIVGRYEMQKGRIEASLFSDPEVAAAIEVLENKTEYDGILAGK